jgi:hypothetical protein
MTPGGWAACGAVAALPDIDHGQQSRPATKTNPRPVVMPFTECRLPGVVYAVTVTVAPLLAQIPPLAVMLHAVSPPVARSHRSGTSPPLNLALRWCPRR